MGHGQRTKKHGVFRRHSLSLTVAGILALVLFAGARTDRASDRDALTAH